MLLGLYHTSSLRCQPGSNCIISLPDEVRKNRKVLSFLSMDFQIRAIFLHANYGLRYRLAADY